MRRMTTNPDPRSWTTTTPEDRRNGVAAAACIALGAALGALMWRRGLYWQAAELAVVGMAVGVGFGIAGWASRLGKAVVLGVIFIIACFWSFVWVSEMAHERAWFDSPPPAQQPQSTPPPQNGDGTAD